MKNNVHFSSHLAQFFLQLKTFQANFVEKIKVQASSSNFFSAENRAVH